MTFLAIDSQKQLFLMKKSQLSFEKSIITSRVETLAKEMEAYTEANSESPDNGENEPEYLEMKNADDYYQTKSDSIDSQITLLDSATSSLDSLIKTNVKNSCTLNLISG